ncbi:hypothetical protein [Stieleria magnilauensis]|uniref:DUF4760 domain-containing protein n=1 Tax=Stieleria magnilauensis TaxID=2527963 RepID=A0ABX5XYW7_9BACT|nr:hypothetical protein TBK1r_62520 [Planctomycetes bacterium TBK1r]
MAMRALGQILMWLGFLGGSFAAVSQLEVQDNKWATVPWLWYAAAMAVGIVGIVLLRRAKREDHHDHDKTDAEYSVITSSLAELSSAVETLCQNTQHPPADTLKFIDDRCAEPLADFADSRQALVKRFGMTVYADVMTEFASAERYVNRSWSAAADGYVDEVDTSLRRAHQHLANARELISKAEQNA